MRKLKLFSVLMCLFIGIGQVWGYTITFKNTNGADGSQAKTAVADIVSSGSEYVSSVAATKVYQGKDGFGIKVGASSGSSSISLGFTTSGQVKPTKIIVNACRWEGNSGFDTGNLNYKINDASTTTTITLTNTLEDHEISMDGNTTLTSLYLAPTTKRIYIKSITVETGSTNPTLSLTPTTKTLNGLDVDNQSVTLTASHFAQSVTSVTTGLYNNADCAAGHEITSGAWVKNINVNNTKTAVTFDVDDNPSTTTQRQCWLKITAENNSESASAILPITQNKAPLSTMQQIYNAAPNTAANADIKFSNTWVITGVTSNKKTAYLSDGTKGMILYNSANTSNPIAGLEAGNTLSGVVTRSLVKFHGSSELTGFVLTDLVKGTGGSVDVNILATESAVSELAGVNTGSLIQISGPCVVENEKYYIKYSDNVKVQVYSSIFNPSLTEGKLYTCTGVFVQYDDNKEILPRSAADIVELTCDVDPTLGATTVDNIGENGATLHSAGITAIGNHCEITSYGFEYSVNSDFSNATHVEVGTTYATASTAFEHTISNALSAGTQYYVRAYATNGHGTSYAVLEGGFETEESTSPQILVSSSSHGFGQVLTTAEPLSWKFTVTGANLTENVSISGASGPISLSSSSLTYTDVLNGGVEVTVTLTPDEAISVNQTLTLSANGTSIYVTITASVIAPYEVTFNVPNGLTAPTKQYVTPGQNADLTVTPTGSLATCTFLGWVSSQYNVEQTTAITPLTSYTPNGDANLYALFKRMDGQEKDGFKLSVASDKYVGAYNSNKCDVEATATDAEVLFFDEEGYIYYYDAQGKKYLYYGGSSTTLSNKPNKSGSADWTITESNNVYTIKSTSKDGSNKDRYFAYNPNNGNPRFAMYLASQTGYLYEFTKTAATKEVGTYYYSTAPVVPELSSLEITTPPSKTDYFEGDDFEATNMVVVAHYTGGKADQTITFSDIEITPATNLPAGTTFVTVSYGGKSIQQPITVTAIALQSIAVAAMPTKTTYKVNDTFNSAGLVVNAVFNDVTKNRALTSSEYTLSTPDMTTAGQKAITITANSNPAIQTSFNIQVNTELTGIEVNTENAKTVYVEGEVFDPTGIIVTASYTGGSSHTVENVDYDKSGVLKDINTLTEPTQVTVTVSYSENDVDVNTTFNVTVNPYPRYSVTFTVRGNAGTPVSETSAQGGVAVPEDPATVGEYTFAGWSKTTRTVESPVDPELVTVTAGAYYPTENTVLHAVYTRNAEAEVHGMYLTCDIDGNGTNKTISYYSSNKLFPTDQTHSALAMWFKDGLLFYMNGEDRTYVYNVGGNSNSAYLYTTTDKDDATTYAWEKIDNDNGTITFKHLDARILGWNESYFRAYNSTYRHEFTVEEATETIIDEIPHYTTSPVMTYAVTYYKNTTDDVDNMPTPNPAHTDANGDITLSANVPTREGKIFNGWNTDALGNGIGYTKEQVLTGLTADLNLYAQWRNPSNYTMTYDANGGELMAGKSAITPEIVVEGNSHTVKTNVYAVEGKIFTGWRAGDDIYNAGDIIEPTSAMTFVAQWSDPTISDFVLVTDVKQLKDGDKVYIVAAGNNYYALGTQNSGNYRNVVEIAKQNDHIIELTSTPVELTLGKDGNDYTFYDGENYLGWTSGNTLINEGTISNNSTWTITIDENGTKIANKSNNEREIRFNSNPKRFATYAGSVLPVVIYKRPDYSRTVSGNYGTICLPKAGKIEGASLYEIAYYGEASHKIFFDEILNNEMVAGRPYIFLPNEGASKIDVYYSDNTATPVAADNYKGLRGFYDLMDEDATFDIPQNAGNYIMYSNQYWLVSGRAAYIENYRAYIKLSEITTTKQALAPGTRRVSLNVNGEQTATDIDELNASEAPVKVMIDGKFYILRGEKLYDATGRLVK